MSEKTLTKPFFSFRDCFSTCVQKKIPYTQTKNPALKKPQAHPDGQYLMHTITLHTQASLHRDTRHRREQPKKRKKMCF